MEQRKNWQFEAIGTRWTIDTSEELDIRQKKDIQNIIEAFDGTYSRFRDDSLVSKIAASTGSYEFPQSAEKMLLFYRQLYDATEGAVSPLVGTLLEDAGYDKQYSFRVGEIRPVPKWDDALQCNGTRVTTEQPVTLDFGAAGKGYLVDIIAEYIESIGLTQYTINASGDIRTRGDDVVIGLENPFDTATAIGTITLKNQSLCGSATNRRAWAGWNHVVDPRTALPIRDVVATWVLSPTTIEADGLATALFFTNPIALKQWNFRYIRLFSDGRIDHSDSIPGELFTR